MLPIFYKEDITKKLSFMSNKNTMCFIGVSLYFKDCRKSEIFRMLSYKKGIKVIYSFV